MTRGGKRKGAGRPALSEELKAKHCSFRLYSWEIEPVKDFIKSLRSKTHSN